MSRIFMIFCFLVCFQSASATTSLHNAVNSHLTSFLTLKTKYDNGVSSALSVLEKLKKMSDDNKNKFDKLDSEYENKCSADISAYEEMVIQNQKVAQEATTNKESIEQDIHNTTEFIEWIDDRSDQITQKKAKLEEQRYASNAFFIKSLKQNQEAIEVIELLKQEVQPSFDEGEQMKANTQFAQIKSTADKLKQYSHLFDIQSINELNQLFLVQLSDESSQELNDEKNEQQLNVQDTQNNKFGRSTKGNIQDKLVEFLSHLKDQLNKSIEDLTQNEIKSNWELMEWQEQEDAELIHLANERDKNRVNLEQFNLDFQKATAHEQQSWKIHSDSIDILSNYSVNCENKHDYYMKEILHQEEDSSILAEIIQIFTQQASKISQSTLSIGDQEESTQD